MRGLKGSRISSYGRDRFCPPRAGTGQILSAVLLPAARGMLRCIHDASCRFCALPVRISRFAKRKSRKFAKLNGISAQKNLPGAAGRAIDRRCWAAEGLPTKQLAHCYAICSNMLDVVRADSLVFCEVHPHMAPDRNVLGHQRLRLQRNVAKSGCISQPYSRET